MVNQNGTELTPTRRGPRYALLPAGWDATAPIGELSERLTALAALDLEELRTQWQGLYRSTPPLRFSRDLLQRSIAHRMQEEALGGLSAATQRQLPRDSRPAGVHFCNLLHHRYTR